MRLKIIAWSFVPAVIILSAVAWFTYYSYQQVLVDQAIKQDWAVVHTKGEKIYQEFAKLANSRIRPIILNIDTKPESSREVRAQNILDQAQGLEIFDGGIYLLDQQGKIFKTWPERSEMIGQDWSDTPTFRYLHDTPPGSSPITVIRAIGPDEQKIVCVTWPMHNPQRVFIWAGYYCFAIEKTAQNDLYELFDSLSLGPDVYLLDGNQQVIFSPDPAQLGGDLSKEASIQQLLQSESMSIRFQKGTEGMVITYNPLNTVKDEGWR